MAKTNDAELRQPAPGNSADSLPPADNECGCAFRSCCSPPNLEVAGEGRYAIKDVVASYPEANLWLNYGNSLAFAALQPGETVLDLGSGSGYDCFLAARAIGDDGFVIGVETTPGLVNKARLNVEKVGFGNVDFRLGELENLPVADGVVDVIISSFVINLAPEKEKVFSEAYRVLKPGGRLAISEIVATAEMPEEVRKNLALPAGCIGGASTIKALESMLTRAGFDQIEISQKPESKPLIRGWMPGSGIEKYVVLATIAAVKPTV